MCVLVLEIIYARANKLLIYYVQYAPTYHSSNLINEEVVPLTTSFEWKNKALFL